MTKMDVNTYQLFFSDGTVFKSEQSVNAGMAGLRLVNGYNETYSKGFSPAAMGELYMALINIVNTLNPLSENPIHAGLMDYAQKALQNAKSIDK